MFVAVLQLGLIIIIVSKLTAYGLMIIKTIIFNFILTVFNNNEILA